MLRSYLLVAWRNLLRNKLFIFRAPLSDYAEGQAPTRSGADNHPAVGPAMKAAFPEIEEYARMSSTEIWFPSVVITGNNDGKPFEFNENKVYYADPSKISIVNTEENNSSGKLFRCSPGWLW